MPSFLCDVRIHSHMGYGSDSDHEQDEFVELLHDAIWKKLPDDEYRREILTTDEIDYVESDGDTHILETLGSGITVLDAFKKREWNYVTIDEIDLRFRLIDYIGIGNARLELKIDFE